LPQFEDASGFRGEAAALYTPSSRVELVELLMAAFRSATPVTVVGGATGVTGGGVPTGGWAISLEKFRNLDIRTGSATVGAGVRLTELQEAARATGQFYAPDPTEMTATLGGSIATNASGSRTFRYGPTRDHIRALRVAMMPGKSAYFRRSQKVDFDYTPLPAPLTSKAATGYYLRENLDWVDLFIGSEGTLGIVLEAEVALLPLPASRLSGVIFFPNDELALAAVDAWRPVEALNMLEYLDCASLLLLRERFPEIPESAQAALLIEQEGENVDEWLARLEQSGALGEASWFGTSDADRERFRRFRHALPEMVNDRVRRAGFQKMGTDFAVPHNKSAEMMSFYRERLTQEFPGRAVIFGHIGNAHVHVNLLPESEDDLARGRQLIEEFARKAISLGGTLSAEHGLGKRKAHLLELEFGSAGIQAMRAVKRRLDPKWLLGQGTLLSPC